MGLFSDKIDDILSRLSSNELRVAEIIKELRRCGFNFWQIKSLEVKHLVDLLETHEHIQSAIYGHNPDSDKAIIVATDVRIIYMDYIPLFHTIDEINYSQVTGVSYSSNGIRAAITLHNSQKDFTLRYVRLGMARRFVDYIEARSIED